MRVAVLTWRDSGHPDGGGSEVFVERVAAGLVAAGHEVTVLCARYPGSAAASVHEGVRFVRRGGRLTVYPRALAWLMRHRRRTDVVLDVVNGLPFASPLVRRRGVVALVHHVHQRQWQIIYPGLAGRFGWWVERTFVPLLYRSCPVVTVSEASRADLVRLGLPAEHVSVVHNGVDPPSATALRSPEPRLSLLARLVPHKQIEHAFDVVERLLPDFPEVRLDVVGEGWWRDPLLAELAVRGLGDHVVLHGHVDAVERDRLLAASQVMLLPSAKEGWGLAVMEAAAVGTPTIAYRDAGGVTESVLDRVTGVLVEDVEGLYRAAHHLLARPEEARRLGTAARARARQFTWSATTRQVEMVLARAAGQVPDQELLP